MSYLVSARKYRPPQFKDVVGQQSVTQTLKNAIKTGKLAQSFLFCGPRGVGKTTCARILAKVINCENPSTAIEPCNECNSCKSFNASASFNIFELDAASNNSVEDIRSLIEQVRFAPQQGKYKIYIIDEVHMLSQAAFNAFLKTLEEPPSYAIFILATTEKHKIIPTILSRCQIFDFQRIKVADIAEHLQYICHDQQINADTDALFLIAQKADGGLRDALSMFDRVAAFGNGKVTYPDALNILNLLDYDYFFKIVNAILAQNTTESLLILDTILQQGFDGENFIIGLASHFRNLLVCKDPLTLKLLDVTETVKKRYWEQANFSSNSFIVSCLTIINQCEINYRTSKNKRLQVEITLIKMCLLTQTIDISKLTHNTTPPANTPNPTVENKQLDEKKNDITHINLNEAKEKLQNIKANYTPSLNLNTLNEPPTPTTPNNNHLAPPIESPTLLPLTPQLLTQYTQEYAENLKYEVIAAAYKKIETQLSENELVITAQNSTDLNFLKQDIPNFMAFLQQKNINTAILSCEIQQNTNNVLSAKVENNTPNPNSISVIQKIEIFKAQNPEFENLIKQFDLKIE